MILILVNAAILIAIKAVGLLQPGVTEWIINTFGVDGASSITLLEHPWSGVSYMFIQLRPSHLIANMLWLASFGIVYERAYGARNLLVAYLAGGIAGAIVFVFATSGDTGSSSVLIGSSAATLSVAFAALTSGAFKYAAFPAKLRKMLIALAITTAMLFALYEFIQPDTTYYSHPAGIAVGSLIGLYVWHKRRQRITQEQIAAERRREESALLEKANAAGFAALTLAERKQLFNNTIKTNSQNK